MAVLANLKVAFGKQKNTKKKPGEEGSKRLREKKIKIYTGKQREGLT